MAETTEVIEEKSRVQQAYTFLCVLGAALLLAADWCMNLVEVSDLRVGEVFGVSLLRPAMAAGYILCAIFPLRARTLPHNLAFRAVLPICLLVGHLLFTYAALLPFAHALRALGATLYGLAFAFLLLYWITALCALSPRTISIAFPAVYFMVALMYFVLEALPAPIATAAISLLPFASGVCFLASLHLSAHPTNNPNPVRPAQGWNFPFYPVALMVVFKFVFFFSLAYTNGASMYGPLGMLVISTFALAGAVFFYDGFQLGFLYKIALPCLVTGLLIVSWVNLGNNAATMASNAGNIAFELFILITLAEACKRFSVDPYWLFGIVEAAAALCGTAGLYAGRLFAETFPGGTFGANAVTMAMVVILVTLSAFLYDERISTRSFSADGTNTQQNTREPSTPEKDSGLDLRCAVLARRYNLSRREEEILELLAQGMSVARIEEELFISRSTVKTHIQHVYEKLGVHSHEEALQLVEQS